MKTLRNPRHWTRAFWGIEFRNGVAGERPMLIGTLWDDDEHLLNRRASEPTRALLLCTRAQARTWCARKNAEYVARPVGDPCRAWRVRPVRVRETVKVLQ